MSGNDDNMAVAPVALQPKDLPAWRRIKWIAAASGALYGLVMRLVFGHLTELTRWLGLSRDTGDVMSTGFVLMTPVVVGALTVYVMRGIRPTWGQAIFMPWRSILLMMLGSMVTLLEGSICVILMAPAFVGLASLGGLLMKAALETTRIGTVRVGALATMPLLFTVLAGPMTNEQWQRIDRSTVIDAPPERIWSEIVDARDIRREELPATLIHLIGVPRPVEGINHMTPEGEVRDSRWERGVHFRGHVTQREEGRTIAWRYEFKPDSFPPGTMDEHVVVGGRYFDLGETRFTLTPIDAGHTRLEVQAHYRVTSGINAYAVPVAGLLGRDFVDTLLALYKRRSESAA